MDRRFAWGVALIVTSLAIGVVFKFVFLARFYGSTKFHWAEAGAYLADPVTRWLVIIYVVSWPMLFFGIWLCGKEGIKYAERFTKYISYKFYHKQAKKHVPRLAKKARTSTKRILAKSRKQTARIVRRGTQKTRHALVDGGWVVNEKGR